MAKKLPLYDQLLFATALQLATYLDADEPPSGSDTDSECVTTPGSDDFSAEAHTKRIRRLELDRDEYARRGMHAQAQEKQEEKIRLERAHLRRRGFKRGGEEQECDDGGFVKKRRKSREERQWSGVDGDVVGPGYVEDGEVEDGEGQDCGFQCGEGGGGGEWQVYNHVIWTGQTGSCSLCGIEAYSSRWNSKAAAPIIADHNSADMHSVRQYLPHTADNSMDHGETQPPSHQSRSH
ncbi:hypothetical protein M409DRAFT_60313 [Zasmidium cellare ATCC 36951]|uniref:Uncharacterized protein n=1 Tax=Zasmidium cellare ATCC 36951 TaxID=1080233 RepID=A0A6A6C2U3_ZASCE|nr:uncharacterized protein M409DRAFT_60313 [Zasmidium cellare ATCC 36951]KAF2160059.1 hypothetical protein M409DRAFT_60313 [Zasmidium cellare ATCC 36951]